MTCVSLVFQAPLTLAVDLVSSRLLTHLPTHEVAEAVLEGG